MHRDVRLRAATRTIYDACYPSEEWTSVGFDEAERCGTVHYRQAVAAAQQARCVMPMQASNCLCSHRHDKAEGRPPSTSQVITSQARSPPCSRTT
jgi:hypothetical protein